jgi:hypothetical protein
MGCILLVNTVDFVVDSYAGKHLEIKTRHYKLKTDKIPTVCAKIYSRGALIRDISMDRKGNWGFFLN